MKRAWRYLLPILISLGLITWLLSTVSLPRLVAALAGLRWQLLVPATVVMVLALYFWDGLCLKTVYHFRHATISYRRMLQVRGMSYLVTALHSQLGQAMVVWNVAKLQRMSLLTTLSRGLVLMWHDGVVLLGGGLLGAIFSPSPRAPYIRVFCAVLLALLLIIAVIRAALPDDLRKRARRTRLGAGLKDWTWRHTVKLLGLRVVYYAILGLYAGAALRICGIPTDFATTLAGVPLVLLADALPSVSGLGTRDAALRSVFGAEHKEILLAMGLVWWSGLVSVRLAIGLIHLWLVPEILIRPSSLRFSEKCEGSCP